MATLPSARVEPERQPVLPCVPPCPPCPPCEFPSRHTSIIGHKCPLCQGFGSGFPSNVGKMSAFGARNRRFSYEQGGWRRRADSNRRIGVLQTPALDHLATSPRGCGLWCRGGDSNSYSLKWPQRPQRCVSTSSTTSARRCRLYVLRRSHAASRTTASASIIANGESHCPPVEGAHMGEPRPVQNDGLNYLAPGAPSANGAPPPPPGNGRCR